MSLDRINNDGDYAPGNVRWATRRQQMLNQRRSAMLTVQNRTMTMTEWSDETGVPVSHIWNRIHNCGWSVERAVTDPVMTLTEAAVRAAAARWCK